MNLNGLPADGWSNKLALGLLSTVIAALVSGCVGFLTTSLHAIENAQQRLGVLESQRQGDAARLQRIEDKLDRLVEQAAARHAPAKAARPDGGFHAPAKPAGLELAAALLAGQPLPGAPAPTLTLKPPDERCPHDSDETVAPGPRHRPEPFGRRLPADR